MLTLTNSTHYILVGILIVGFAFSFWLLFEISMQKRKEDKEDEIRRKNRKMQPRPENPADQ